GAADLMAALRLLDAEGVDVLDVGLRRPTLDDVFLTLTGHVAEPVAAAGAPTDTDLAGSTGHQTSPDPADASRGEVAR
ncbi:MAG: hypothetical protein WD041_03630, partial [Nitriliruptoraceae bacterium]